MGRQTFISKLEIEEALRIKIIERLDLELKANGQTGLSQRYKDIILSVGI